MVPPMRLVCVYLAAVAVLLQLLRPVESSRLLSSALFLSRSALSSVDSPSSEPSGVRNVVIIGSGPAGCTAALYTGRALLSPLVLGGYNAGGQLMLTSDVENFPGYRQAISGPDLIADLTTQAVKFGAEIVNKDVAAIDLTQYPYRVTVDSDVISTRSIILATGANAVWLGAEREEEFKGKGISTCATCDGFMFRNQKVVVIGGGDSAMEEANFLTRFASEVTLIHRSDKLRASKIMTDRARNNPKIRFRLNTVVRRWAGENGLLSGAEIVDTATGQVEQIACTGAFIAIGHRPNTAFLPPQIKLDSSGYVTATHNTMTSIPGVFACGDVVDTRYRQAITAAGSGCQAAIDAEKWLEEQHTAPQHTVHDAAH